MLLRSSYMSRAARAAGVGDDTIYHWLADPDHPFTRAYVRAREAAFGTALSQLQIKTGKAVNLLVKSLDSSNQVTSQQITAATRIIELALRSYETVDSLGRLARLERAFAGEQECQVS